MRKPNSLAFVGIKGHNIKTLRFVSINAIG